VTPDGFTNSEMFMDVGDGHQLYVQDWGNEKAKTPIIFLHGGPGSQSKDKHKQTFDASKQRVIFFDQRGCGRSLPYGSLKHNTTTDLVEDIKKIIRHLKLGKVVLTGGSWGCALALFYAIAHPEHIEALVLDGIWTSSRDENQWIDKGRFRDFLPDVWERYVQTVPASHSDDPSRYHFKRILGSDEQATRESAYAYGNMEGAALSLDDRFTTGDPADFDPAGVRIEIHYLSNNCFMPDRYIFNNAHKLTMPIWLVQGRYDMVCPPITAYELHKKLPNSNLIWTTSGHKAERESWNVIKTILMQWS
jgi:proline iminopeptidase